jgi:hypothetical protein
MAALPTLPILRTLGGCGGTIVSKCLGAMEGTVLLSESSPFTARLFDHRLNPLAMLRRHAPEDIPPAFVACDAEALANPEVYGNFVGELQGRLAARKRRLVIRDYGYGDFIGRPFVTQAANRSSLDEALRGRFNLREVYLVRHPIDQYLSLRGHKAVRRNVDARTFMEGVVRATAAYKNSTVIRFEDFLQDPDAILRRMTEALGLPFDPQYPRRMGTAAPMLTGHARGARAAEIKAPKHKLRHWYMRCIYAKRPLCQMALASLGYGGRG